MKVNIISNIEEGKGLYRDYLILKEELEPLGCEVEGLQFNKHDKRPSADLNIHLEVCGSRFMHLAKVNWLIPNPEWWFEQNNVHLRRFDKILCKTRDACALFRPLVPDQMRIRYIGFRSDDHYDESVPREKVFMHNPGNSIVRGTEAVLTAWQRFGIDAELVVVGDAFKWSGPMPDRVKHWKRLGYEEFKREQNRCLFHICPSEYEGFGHVVHEPRSCGNLVMVPDAPPLNELEAIKKLCVGSYGTQRLARTAKVGSKCIADAANWALGLSDLEIDYIRKQVRHHYLGETKAFKLALQRELSGVKK